MSRTKSQIRSRLPAWDAGASRLPAAVSQLINEAQPRYASVAAALAGEILEKRRPIGSLLPTEQELSQHFAVSRSTVRQALRRLRELGLVAGAQGVGTRVIADQPRSDYLLAVRSVTDVMGYSTPTRLEVLLRETVTADAAYAERIGAEAGSQWVHLHGLRWPEDRTRPPISVVELHVAARFAAVTTLPELVSTPAYRLIAQRMGIAVAEVLQEITAIALPEGIAQRFSVPAGSPGLHIRRRFLASDGTLLEATDNYHAAADRFAYALRLGSADGET
ncbi:GntR family transcriptional regulator [Teichococcus vastitatis]|uniref:GntR family transcriptional regulator n=1 Tax=Teichococcus vastitatis TaxID=2307076 RepID=A0ABS9W3E4_9PROT|nr:GntR family transcriptional regulator [Pseudoroseomonas vastitatis]MCI0753816.1 GntR family transcriptional regulator [Pseudoroseomonas vastitatis]